MDKGIRIGVRSKFAELLPQLATIGGKKFRKEVIFWAVEQFGCTINAACTHYNFVKTEVTKATPTAVAGLGRAPEKNNGGRKKKVAPVVGPVLLLGYTPVGTLISEGVKENTSVQTVTINPVDDVVDAALGAAAGMIPDTAAVDSVPNDSDVAEEPKLYTVRKASDGTVVAEGVALEIAEKLVAKAVAAKKAKLVFA